MGCHSDSSGGWPAGVPRGRTLWPRQVQCQGAERLLDVGVGGGTRCGDALGRPFEVRPTPQVGGVGARLPQTSEVGAGAGMTRGRGCMTKGPVFQPGVTLPTLGSAWGWFCGSGRAERWPVAQVVGAASCSPAGGGVIPGRAHTQVPGSIPIWGAYRRRRTDVSLEGGVGPGQGLGGHGHRHPWSLLEGLPHSPSLFKP